MVDGVIVLYDQNETSFTSNGLGYLPDATECIVTEELNGEFELQMEYPINGLRYKEIQHRRILLVKTNPYEDPQPFRIYNINKPIDGLVEINARHISYDLSGYAIPWVDDGEGNKSGLPFATGPASFMTNFPNLVNQLNSGMPQFTYWTNSTEDWPRDPDDEKENELKEPHWIFVDQPMNARNLIGQFTEKYKGEFKWDRFNVKFYGPISGQSEDDTRYRGKDSGVVLRYGKNLTDLMQEEDSDKGMYTHIYPYWSGSIEVQDGSNTKSKETIIELPEKLYPVFKDYTPDYKRIYVYDCTSDYTDELKSKDGQKYPSEETLKEMCDKLIKDNKLGTPNITLTASFVQLSKSVEYKDLALLEKILLGDTVTVYFPDLDVDSTLKCTSIEYNVLTDEYRTITLGESSASVSNTIANTASMSSSNSTAIAGSATKNDVFGKTYDTALSTTSENAVQNKVVTGAISYANDAITLLKNQYSTLSREIQELIDSGSKVTFGTITPENSMGEDGEIYVKIKHSSVEEHNKWHGYARNSNSASYSWFISKKKYNCEANTKVRLKGSHSRRAAQWAFVSLSPVNTGNPWECGGPTTNWYPQASELTDFDINVTLNNSTANDYYIWVWIDQGNEYTIDYIDLNGREIAINDDKFVCGASYNDNISEFISDAPPEEYDEIVSVYYKHNGVWLANSNKEILTGTIPPTQSTGNNDNVYIDFKYSSLEDYKLTKVWDCGGGWYGGFDLTVNKTAADQPTAFLFDGYYQQSIEGCNEWYIELSDLTPGDVITISFDYQMVQQNPNFDITPYINTDAWYQHGICVLGVENARDSRIWSNDSDKVKYGWSEASSFLSVHQDWDPHSYEFDYTVESSKVYIYFNWQGWTRSWEPSTIYDPPRKASINITNFVISQKVKTIVGIDNVYYKYEGKWWQDDAQQYKGDFIKDIASNISTGTVIANATNKNDVSIPIRVPYGVQSISPTQVIDHPTPIATITNDDGTTQTLYAPAGGGGGGGGSAIGLTLLYDVGSYPTPTSGTDNVDRDLTLADNIDNYDAIFITACLYVYGDPNGSYFYSTTDQTMLILKDSYYPPVGTYDYTTNAFAFAFNGSFNGNNRRLLFSLDNSGTSIHTQARRSESDEEAMIYRVYGLTFGGGGSSLPSGGTTGQALVKQSGTDYDADWDDIIQVPAGGTTGQVLGKISGTNYDIGWINQSGGGGGGSGLEQTLLYSAQSTSSPNTITLSESWENFDAIYLIVESDNFLMEALYLKEDLVSGYRIGATSDIGFCWYNITNDPTSLTKQSATSGYFMKTIRGIEFGSGGGSGSDDYSTTETQIGTWIDGKPLYRKVITGTVNHTDSPASGMYSYDYAHGIQNIELAVRIDGFITSASGNSTPIGYYTTWNNQFVSAWFNATNLGFRYSTMYDNRPFTAILEYTKTTD